MISNGALSDSFRASNTFSSFSVNGRRLSRSSLMGMTTEIHGCDEGVMRNWNARGPSRAFYPRPSGDSNRSHSPEHNAASTCDVKGGSFETNMMEQDPSLWAMFVSRYGGR